MFAQQPAYASHAVVSVAALPENFGEQVLIAPRQAGAFDDRVCASHATFAWRAATKVVPQADGRRLHLESYRLIARFAGDRVPPGLCIGDRITRSWDGEHFEVVSAYREGSALCCELVELGRRVH